jgi:hypothetical protein
MECDFEVTLDPKSFYGSLTKIGKIFLLLINGRVESVIK